MRTRHIGIVGLSAQSTIMGVVTSICDTFDPTNPMTLIMGTVMAFTAILTGRDYIKNSGKN